MENSKFIILIYSDKAKKLLQNLLTKDNEKYNHLWKILKDIEKMKEKGMNFY